MKTYVLVRMERWIRAGDSGWICNQPWSDLGQIDIHKWQHRRNYAFSPNTLKQIGNDCFTLCLYTSASQICSYILRVMSVQSKIFLNNKQSNMQWEVSSSLHVPTAEGLVWAMHSGNDRHSHPYNTIVLLNARKWNLYSQKLGFDSSAVDRPMQSPLWCAWMTDGLFFLF